MNRRLRTAVAWLGLIVTLPCLLCQLPGCQYVQFFLFGYADVSLNGSPGGGEPGTKYFVLLHPSPLAFQGSPWGLKPEIKVGWGNLAGVPLDQYEINFGYVKRCPWDVVAVRETDGRCAEIVFYFRGIVCGRYTFDYDAAGRARRRVATEYEGRREGEGTDEWAVRLKGRPAVACLSEIAYAWSEDGLTAEVTRRVVQGKAPSRPSVALPDTYWDQPGPERETWQLNGKGSITSVLRDGKAAYSAQYDDAGRLLRSEEIQSNGSTETVEDRYDAQGRLLEMRVTYRDKTQGTIVHEYPGGPKAELPQLKRPGDAAWVVTHDPYGRVSRVRETRGPGDDPMSNMFHEFRRDKDGRIISWRVGFAR